MKKISLYIVSALLFLGGTSSCDYLDIVPDNTQEIETLFETKDRALAALGKCYEYMPNYEKFHESMILAGDEMLGRLDASYAESWDYDRGEKLMRGWQNASDPLLSFWNGGRGAKNLYQGIRYCNIYLENINSVPNMTDEEKADGIAQVKILKAWYHFYLIRNYGPIVIVDQNVPESAGVEEVRQERKPVDECFQYCVDLIDDVLYIKDADGNVMGEKSDLDAQRSTTFLGQIDRVIAKAIKAKILLYAASPLFNGNAEYYSTFKGLHGETLFNLEYDKEKWKKALDAIDEAIAEAEKQGKKLYYYDGTPKEFDSKNFYGDANHEHMVFPGMVYITYPTEYGTLYSLDELQAIRTVCDKWKLPLFLDGARLGYGLAAQPEVTLHDIARLCDVFYIGGTKCGALIGEAVVFTHDNEPAHFQTIVKQHGAMLAKGRLIGIQFDVLFTDDLYTSICKHAIVLAMKLKQGLVEKGYELFIDSPTNQQFIVLENTRMEALKKQVGFGFWEAVDENHTAVRFAISWATTDKAVDELLALL